MIVKQRPEFKKNYKKLRANQRPSVNEAVSAVIARPEIGEQKKGDLAGVRVYKFTVLDQTYLWAYVVFEDYLSFWAFGLHENFYRDLKK